MSYEPCSTDAMGLKPCNAQLKPCRCKDRHDAAPAPGQAPPGPPTSLVAGSKSSEFGGGRHQHCPGTCRVAMHFASERPGKHFGQLFCPAQGPQSSPAQSLRSRSSWPPHSAVIINRCTCLHSWAEVEPNTVHLILRDLCMCLHMFGMLWAQGPEQTFRSVWR